MAQYTLTDEQAAALGLIPTESAPVEPVAASPFALAGVNMTAAGKIVTDDRPAAIREAAASAPPRKAQEWARQAARIGRIPLYSCTVDVTVGGVSMAAHGYAFAGKPGAPCKGTGCKGKVRA